MKVLIIGNGGREHALAWRMSQEPEVTHVYAVPGNPGIGQVGECHASFDSLDPDLTIVGPEAPLIDGIVDRFRAQGKRIVGPTANMAQMEGSKTFAKLIMAEAGVPTARFITVDSVESGKAALRHYEYPVVLKADGLAAGKGVVIAQSEYEAHAALSQLLAYPGSRVVIEEFLEGEEVSFIILSDGQRVIPLAATQDHKRIGDGDTGPNTGGMGAYCDGRILTPQQSEQIINLAILPVIDLLRSKGTPYTGFLYAGMMMTAQGPKVLEFNVRLGDPETQALMHRLNPGFANALLAASEGNLTGITLDWRPEPSVCVVMAASGYPGTPRTGDPITGLPAAESTGATVFQAGTKSSDGAIRSSGGRVLGVTSSGVNLSEAISHTYAAVEEIHFEGMQFRRDIAQRGLKRW